MDVLSITGLKPSSYASSAKFEFEIHFLGSPERSKNFPKFERVLEIYWGKAYVIRFSGGTMLRIGNIGFTPIWEPGPTFAERMLGAQPQARGKHHHMNWGWELLSTKGIYEISGGRLVSDNPEIGNTLLIEFEEPLTWFECRENITSDSRVIFSKMLEEL